VIMAGFIAYAGDVLGAMVGRRRLSLFGWRPRRTGQVVGVAGGILIMLVTLGTLMLANRGAAGVLISAQETYLELRELQTQVAERTEELEQAQRTIQEAQQARQMAFAERDAALEERDELQQEIGSLEERMRETSALLSEADSLRNQAQAELETVQADLQVANAEMQSLTSERNKAIGEVAKATARVYEAQRHLREAELQRDEAEAALERARNETQVLQQTNVGLQAEADQLRTQNRALSSTNEDLSRNNTLLQEQNDELERRMESLLAERERLRTETDTLTEQLQEQEIALSEAQRVISSPLAYRANEIVHKGAISAQETIAIQEQLQTLIEEANRKAQRRGAGGVTLSSVQFASLQEAIMETPGEDVVVLYSPINQISQSPDAPQAAEPLRVEIDAFENTRLFDAGQLVVTRQIFVGSDVAPVATSDLMTEIARLNTEAANKLQRLGLFEGERPQRAPDTLSEDILASQLSRLSGSVEIGLITHDQVFRGGPALLELVIIQ
jgi:uncharacterized protein (DUF3084 family)